MSKASLLCQRQLLQYLADGGFYSGQWLAEQLGVSRTAVANYLNDLKQHGLEVFSVKGRGYKLAYAIQLLDASKIKAIQTMVKAPILVQHITDSTNCQLLQRLEAGHIVEPGSVIVAEAQSAGRGRRGRSWYSPFGANLYFSCYWRLEQGVSAAMGLSLAVGLAICRLLQQQYQLDAKVKWPNDIYVNDKKIAGILVELSGTLDASCNVVIGIGLNIGMPEHSKQHIDQPYTDLRTESMQQVDRNNLVVELQRQVVNVLQDFAITGFAPFVAEFNQHDLFENRKVTLVSKLPISGICRGVDKQGGIIIETEKSTDVHYGGELSLRAGE
ncbi:bifunctional biotin--[acetyl-CoA-carboxylase] ligase/biotin operon repressor BirA [Arsukibacterium sp.]|uniref:bifunctional biotin--[acetyl-CoA-carboxylase] ligase/biotin operon repressor BirA n=1 Tax=Arsukibacterium sp. TaxID=1977258 RepID=UPI001BD4930F|nr:bifunctional biotin--[acetyl-CoA-carboxylase] ligase/biotin operon repressor BirA [Arsukibacterium sp.]